MPTTITKICLKNFKRFRDYTIIPNFGFNVLAGDNETGKSSILEAIDLVATGSKRRIESIGIDRLLNITAVQEFIICIVIELACYWNTNLLFPTYSFAFKNTLTD